MIYLTNNDGTDIYFQSSRTALDEMNGCTVRAKKLGKEFTLDITSVEVFSDDVGAPALLERLNMLDSLSKV